MNHDQFSYWLRGFIEMNEGKEPTTAQWKMIKDHSIKCFASTGVRFPMAQFGQNGGGGMAGTGTGGSVQNGGGGAC